MFWSALELYPLLGYAKWDRFKDVLSRAKESCGNAGEKFPIILPTPGQ